MVRADIAVIMAGPCAERRFADEPQREHVGTVSDDMQGLPVIGHGLWEGRRVN